MLKEQDDSSNFSKKRKGFDPDKIKEFKSNTLILDTSNKVEIKKISYEGEEYLTINKFYKPEKGSVWFRGKGLWLNYSTAEKVIKESLKIFKEK